MSERSGARRLPLYEKHVELGARMVEFAGFWMPLQYEGIIKEHEHVRNSCGLFDLSHMGEFELSGAMAVEDVRRLVTNDTLSLEDGQVLYTPMCRENGTIVDDLLVYRHGPDRWMMVVNAANIAKDSEWIRSKLGPGTAFTDLSERCCLLALQGPASEDVLSRWVPMVKELPSFHFIETQIGERAVLVSRTGYTGEDGFEIYCGPEAVESLWDLFLSDGRVKPAGLGARDTLRFEARLVLYGNDIDDTTTPLEAGLGWCCKFDGPDFIGKEALLEQKKRGVERKLAGFEMVGRGVPRHGYDVYADGRKVGKVTSGMYAPTLRKNLGLAYVPRSHAKVGSRIDVDVRGRMVEARIVKTPFYKRAG